MKLSSSLFAGSVAALLFFAPKAQANPITYQLSTVASGQIGGTSFTNAPVTFTGTGDTANVQALAFGLISYFANPLSSMVVTIGGIGTATILDPPGIWSFPQPVPGFIPLPAVIMGRIDSPPVMDSFTAFGFALNAGLAGYGLTPIGPLTGPGAADFDPLCNTSGHDSCIATSLGFLRITSEFAEGGEATFRATAAVPEPATLVLLGSGVAALAGRSRSRTRRSKE